MLRVECQGKPYDWFNLDELQDAVREEAFVHTLRENIVHYFSVPLEYQAIFDEEGLLATPPDFARALQHVRPFFRVFDLRDMPAELKEQTQQKLALYVAEATRVQRTFSAFTAGVSPEISSCSCSGPCRPSSPWGRDPRLSMATPVMNGVPATPPQAPPLPQYGFAQPQIRPMGPLPGAPLFSLSPGPVMGQMVRPPGPPEPIVPGGMPPWAGCVPRMEPIGFQSGLTMPLPGAGLPQFQPSVARAQWPTPMQEPQMAPAFDNSVEVVLTKDTGEGRMERFGFANVPTTDSRALAITWIDQSGLLAMWNRSKPALAVREGDFIVSVNGISGDIEAMRKQLSFESARMIIQRVPHP